MKRTKRIVVTLLMLFMVFGTVHAQRARDHLAQGREHLQAQRFEEAITSFQAALQLEPRNRQVPPLLLEAQTGRTNQIYEEANRLRQAGNIDEASAMYDRAIQSAPHGYNTRQITDARTAMLRERTELLFAEGQSLHRERNFAEAIARFNAAIAAAPLEYNTRNIVNARTQSERERQEAEARALAESAMAELNTANEHFLAGRYAQAVTSYESAIAAGGLNNNQTREANDLIAASREIQSNNRALVDADFTVTQNRDGTITITGFNVQNTRRSVRINGQNHEVSIGITDLVIPARLYGANVTIIGERAFREKGLTSVVIPNTVVEISSGAFQNNALTSVTLSNRIVIIGHSAFRNNRITNISFPASIRRIRDSAFQENQITSVTFPNGIEYVSWAFNGNPLAEVIIPASLATRSWDRNRMEDIGFLSSLPNTLTRVTLPANMSDNNLNAFEESLRNYYISQGKRAGTYIFNGIWTRQ